MKDILQYRKVTSLEYVLGKGQMKINMDGTNDNYYSTIDEVEINTKELKMEHLEISENIVSMKFSEPIICNINSGRYYSSMKCGAKLEGKNTSLFVEKLESLSDKIGSFQDESLQELKDKIQTDEKG